jgi:hypothetical protein
MRLISFQVESILPEGDTPMLIIRAEQMEILSDYAHNRVGGKHPP